MKNLDPLACIVGIASNGPAKARIRSNRLIIVEVFEPNRTNLSHSGQCFDVWMAVENVGVEDSAVARAL